ncbi:hypothetical protein P8452_70469 [Trifolium repens]|nr:hypothetical protein P8452_70469 [Trifolium repens]
MAASSSSRNTIIYAVDDKDPIIIDDSEFVSEPDMSSVEDNIWGEELMIPHKLGGRTFAFAGPLPSSDNFSEDAGFDALQQKTPKSKGASKAKDVNTSTDTTTPAATQKKTLPNTGAKLRKRNLMASNEAGGPTKQKKQKALTINEPTPAGNVNPTAAAPSGEGQRDKGKASVETRTEKDAEIPVSNPPVEDQSNANVETPSTGGPILEKINPSLQDPGAQGGNEENTTTPVNNEENSAQDHSRCSCQAKEAKNEVKALLITAVRRRLIQISVRQ